MGRDHLAGVLALAAMLAGGKLAYRKCAQFPSLAAAALSTLKIPLSGEAARQGRGTDRGEAVRKK